MRYVTAVPGPDDLAADADVVLVDCPLLMTPDAAAVLRRADGVVLTCRADPLSLPNNVIFNESATALAISF